MEPHGVTEEDLRPWEDTDTVTRPNTDTLTMDTEDRLDGDTSHHFTEQFMMAEDHLERQVVVVN